MPDDLDLAYHSLAGVIGLLSFLAIFAGVVLYTFTSKNRETFQHMSQLPLDDDAPGGLR